MTSEHIRVVLAIIKECVRQEDFEAAHNHEDLLYYNFILFVSQEANPTKPWELRQLARQILESQKIEYTRRCS